METVTSKDGTTIAFDRIGSGPPVILVSGGSVDRMANAPLGEQLASDFTVFNYDRRGRGPSGTRRRTRSSARSRTSSRDRGGGRRSRDLRVVVGRRVGDARGGRRPAAPQGRDVGAAVPPGLPRPPNRSSSSRRWSPRAGAATRSSSSWPRSSGCRRSSSPGARSSRGGRDRASPTRSRTTPGSWATTGSRGPRRGVKAETLVIAGGADMPFMRDTAQALADALPDGHVACSTGRATTSIRPSSRRC